MNEMGCGCNGDDDGDVDDNDDGDIIGDEAETRVKMVKNITLRLQGASGRTSKHARTHVTYFAWSRCPVTSPFTICWGGGGRGWVESCAHAGTRVFKT